MRSLVLIVAIFVIVSVVICAFMGASKVAYVSSNDHQLSHADLELKKIGPIKSSRHLVRARIASTPQAQHLASRLVWHTTRYHRVPSSPNPIQNEYSLSLTQSLNILTSKFLKDFTINSKTKPNLISPLC